MVLDSEFVTDNNFVRNRGPRRKVSKLKGFGTSNTIFRITYTHRLNTSIFLMTPYGGTEIKYSTSPLKTRLTAMNLRHTS